MVEIRCNNREVTDVYFCCYGNGKALYMYLWLIGVDEPDYGKKLKSLSTLTTELITGEGTYLESLECIVDVSHASFM